MANYWDKRIENLNKEIFKDSDAYVRELRKFYNEEINEIQEKIYNHLLKLQEEAGGISLFEAKKLLNNKELDSFKMGLNEFMKKSKGSITPEIERELNIVSRRVRISRLQAMEIEVKKTVAGLMSREEKGLFAHLGNTFKKRYYKELYELQRITGYRSVQAINKDKLKIVLNNPWTSDGKEFSERIWGRGNKLTSKLRDNLMKDIARGASPEESIKIIEKEFGVSKANAARLVYTETAAISSMATKKLYEDAGVKKYQILATLDLKTSEICRHMDGKVFDTKDYMPGITANPFHPNCRTDTVPYFDDDIQRRMDTTRMARNPETGKSERVPYMNYKEWFGRYVTPYNDEEEYNRIISILGYKVVENLEKYRYIKYNNVDRYNQINREVNTMNMINNKKWEEPFKEKLKDEYYDFRRYGYEFNMHGLERTYSRIQRGSYTKSEVLEVLNKDFNMKQISDDRPVKFYKNIQAIYTKKGIEVHNIIKRKKEWDYEGRLKKYEE